MSSQLNVDTIVDKAGSGGTNVKIANNAVTVSEGGNATTNTVQGLAKAWVNFTGVTNTVERDSFNVATLTDVSTGRTDVVYISAMANNDYSGSYYTNANAGTGVSDFGNAYTGAFGINEFRTTALITVVAYAAAVIDSSQNDVTIVGDLA